MSYRIPPEAIIGNLQTENAMLREQLALSEQFILHQDSLILLQAQKLIAVINWAIRSGNSGPVAAAIETVREGQ